MPTDIIRNKTVSPGIPENPDAVFYIEYYFAQVSVNFRRRAVKISVCSRVRGLESADGRFKTFNAEFLGRENGINCHFSYLKRLADFVTGVFKDFAVYIFFKIRFDKKRRCFLRETDLRNPAAAESVTQVIVKIIPHKIKYIVIHLKTSQSPQ